MVTDPSGQFWFFSLLQDIGFALAPFTGGATLPFAFGAGVENTFYDIANGQVPNPISFSVGGSSGGAWNDSYSVPYQGLGNGVQTALGLPTMADVGPIFDATHASAPNNAPNNGCQLVAPIGRYRSSSGTIALFQPALADRLSAGIGALNDQGITPVITDGYRTQAMQDARRHAVSSGASPFGAARGISAHQVGLAADFGVGMNKGNNAAILRAMTGAGLVNGASFKPSDPVHYNLPNARQSQNLSTAASCAASYSAR